MGFNSAFKGLMTPSLAQIARIISEIQSWKWCGKKRHQPQLTHYAYRMTQKSTDTVNWIVLTVLTNNSYLNCSNCLPATPKHWASASGTPAHTNSKRQYYRMYGLSGRGEGGGGAQWYSWLRHCATSRNRVRFPMMSLELFSGIILPAALWH